MRIFLCLRASDLNKKNEGFFAESYDGIKIDSKYAGKFGWFWIKALKKIGHIINTFPCIVGQMDDKLTFFRKTMTKIRIINPFKFLIEKTLDQRLLNEIETFKPDFVLIDAGWNIYPDTIKKIKTKFKIPVYNWLYDDPVAQNWKNVLQSFPYYDCLFVWDPYYVDEFKKYGAKEVIYLPCACEPDIHKTCIPNYNYQFDIAFVGTITPPRLKILEKLSEFNLGIWTWNPNSLSVKLKKFYKGTAWGEKVSEIYCSSKIALNLHHPQTVFGVNMKTFEIASCGAFQLVDFKKELNNLFELNKEIVSYNNSEELIELIKYYLINPNERKKIALRGQKRAHTQHTYEHRMEKLLQYVSRFKSK